MNGEAIGEVLLGGGIGVNPLIDPPRKNLQRQMEVVLEEPELVRFGFEVARLKVVKNKIQDHEPSTNQIIRKPPAVAKTVFLDLLVDEP
jgi:hypothetical protein